MIQAITDKMIRRHPHVFGDGRRGRRGRAHSMGADSSGEKGDQRRSIVAGIPVSAPALQRAARLGEKVSRVGLDWSNARRRS